MTLSNIFVISLLAYLLHTAKSNKGSMRVNMCMCSTYHSPRVMGDQSISVKWPEHSSFAFWAFQFPIPIPKLPSILWLLLYNLQERLKNLGLMRESKKGGYGQRWAVTLHNEGHRGGGRRIYLALGKIGLPWHAISGFMWQWQLLVVDCTVPLRIAPLVT